MTSTFTRSGLRLNRISVPSSSRSWFITSTRTTCSFVGSSNSNQVRNLHAPALVPKRIPTPRDRYTTPSSILIFASRNLKQHNEKFPTWESLFTSTSQSMKSLGLAVKDRRYLLWILEKYRAGFDVATIAIPAKPKRKIRGWGPKVQNGKRVR